jgi:uncharacterized protein YbaR (Trm112 family)
MQLTSEFLAMLCCPEDRSRLSAVDSALLARLNQAVRAGTLTNRAGRKIEKQLDGGLVRADGQLIYPIIDQIPILLIDEAIWSHQLA